MSDHLPECPVYGHTLIDPGGMSWLPERKKSRIREANARACICPELRACEQRVREEWYEVQSETWEQGYKYALDAARGAVARLQHKPGASIANAVSAIDALVRNYMANSQEPAYNNPQGADDGER